MQPPIWFRTVFLNLVILSPAPGDIWQTFLVVTIGGGDVTGIWLTEARDVVKHSTIHRMVPQQKIMSVVLRNSGPTGQWVTEPAVPLTRRRSQPWMNVHLWWICRRYSVMERKSKGFAGRGSWVAIP